MRAVVMEAFEAPPVVRDDVPVPAPGAGEVLVRVRASSANPVDNAIAAGLLSGMVAHEFPVTLGRDYAGVVEKVGADIGRHAAGDRVFGFVRHADPTVHDGSWAELITVPGDGVARVPDGVDLATAGAAPLAAITAMTAIDALALAAGDTVLVVGATGGVGSFAVQLAAAAGATVVAVGREEDEEYLRDLGAADVVPRDVDVAEAVRDRHPEGADALLDLVSYVPGAYDGALTEDARVASPNGAAGDGPGRTNVMAIPSAENLDRLGRLLADGTLRVPVQGSHDLADAPGALIALRDAHTRGKIAIRVA